MTSNSNIHCQNPQIQGLGTPHLLVISPWNSWPPSLKTFSELFWVKYDRSSAQHTVINVVSVHALHAQFSRVRTSSQALRNSQYWKEYWSDRWLWRFQIWQHNSKQSASTIKLKIPTAPLKKRENKTTVQNLKMAWTIVTIKIEWLQCLNGMNNLAFSRKRSELKQIIVELQGCKVQFWRILLRFSHCFLSFIC